MNRVLNFAGFMKNKSAKRVNEQDQNTVTNDTDMQDGNFAAGYYGANPEEEAAAEPPVEGEEGAEPVEGEEKEFTLDDAKSMLDDLTSRVEKLEGGGEGEEGAEGEEGKEGEEGAEPAEGEEAPEPAK